MFWANVKTSRCASGHGSWHFAMLVMLMVTLAAQAADSPTPPAPPTAPGTTAQPPTTPPAPPVPAPNGLITNVYVDSELRQALSDVATQTGTVILADESVQGTISIEFKDTPLDRALELMLLPGGFVFEQVQDKVYLVTSADAKLPAFRRIAKTQIVRLNYVTTEEIKALMPEIYAPFVKLDASNWQPPNSGSSVSQQRYYSGGDRNDGGTSGSGQIGTTISVTAPSKLLEQIVETIRSFDQPPVQVMIEALVAETTRGNNLDFSWNAQATHLGASNSTGLFTYVGQADKILHQILYLAQTNQAKIKASPRVITQSGRSANVKVATEQYFQLVSGNLTYSYATLQAIESAIGLDIMPQVATADRMVTCSVYPEIGDVTGTGANSLPIIVKRTAGTTVRVADGQIIVIGGLLEQITREIRRRIPILADIPILGKLFQSRSSEKLDREITIFVVPHILEADGSYRGPLLMDRLPDSAVQPSANTPAANQATSKTARTETRVVPPRAPGW